MKRLLPTIALLSGIAVGQLAFAESAGLRLLEDHSSVFGGRPAAWRVEVTSPNGGEGSVAWSLAVSGGVIARREPRVVLRPGEPTIVEIDVDLPGVREGVVADGRLQIALRDDGGQTLAVLEHPIHVFGPDPAAGRMEWLRGLKLTVYDPEGRTAERLDEMGWPHRRISNLSALESVGDGLLLVGEGCSLRGARKLMDVAMRVAQQGGRVLFLAPVDGEFPPPGTEEGSVAPESLQFFDQTYAQRLDRRLDAPPLHSTFRLGGQRTGPVVSVKSGGGWAFMEARWSGGGTLLLCGCGLLETWEASPAPRFLLVRMLEWMTQEKEKEP